MIALSHPADKAIRAQIAESVALIAELDFPTKWPDLIDVRPFHPHRPHLTHSLATRHLPLPHRIQRQPWRTRNRSLYFP